MSAKRISQGQTSVFDYETKTEPDFVDISTILAEKGTSGTPEEDPYEQTDTTLPNAEPETQDEAQPEASDNAESEQQEALADSTPEPVQPEFPEEPDNPELEADPCIKKDEKGRDIIDTDRQKEKFKHICRRYIKSDRAGLERLLKKLESSKNDFYEAPASTQYHGAYDGGLCQHSIDVWECARKLNASDLFPNKFTDEELCVASLFHDICKVGLYKKVEKFRKDNKNNWQKYNSYIISEEIPFGGHGSKSVFMVQRSFNLTYEEAIAINCHMGFSDGSPNVTRDVSKAYNRYPLAWLIHVADEAATFLIKREAEDGRPASVKSESDS